MADHSLTDLDPPRRPRRGPPPRLYVIARQSPVPWLRIRRLGEADRPALLTHLQALAAECRGQAGNPDCAAVAAACQQIDFRTAILFGAIAGNAVIAAGCGAVGAEGLEAVATEDAGYGQRGLAEMLIRQVLGAQPAAELPARRSGDPAMPLLLLMHRLGGRLGAELEDAAVRA